MKNIIFFITAMLVACSSSKENSGKEIKVLPTYIIYSGVPQSPSVKTFISNYLLSRGIKIVSEEEEKKLLQRELQRSLNTAIHYGNSFTTDTAEMKKRISAESRYAVNNLILYFKPIDSLHQSLGWSNLPIPSLTESHKTNIIYYFLPQEFLLPLTNKNIIDLCDTIISSGKLITTSNNQKRLPAGNLFTK